MGNKYHKKKKKQDNKDPDSFSWESSQDFHSDPEKGVTSTTTTENQVLSDGTRIVKTTLTLKQIHVHGATTVKNTNIKRIETIVEEERIVVGEELTFWDCLTCCFPCCKKKKKKGEEEGGGGDGNGGATEEGGEGGADCDHGRAYVHDM